MKKFLETDWLRAMHFLVNTVQNEETMQKQGNKIQHLRAL